jgi:hypothetical protein
MRNSFISPVYRQLKYKTSKNETSLTISIDGICPCLARVSHSISLIYCEILPRITQRNNINFYPKGKKKKATSKNQKAGRHG